MSAVAIVPAAGKGERFGGDKLFADVDGELLLNRTLRSLLDAGIEHVIVVAAPGATLSRASLTSDPRVAIVVNDDPSRGMFSSIQAGMSVGTGDPIVILPADMPFVLSATIGAVIDACQTEQRVIVPTHHDERGHPIVFPRVFRQAVLAEPPTSTLKDALAAAGAVRVELPVTDPGILRDVDTRDDLG